MPPKGAVLTDDLQCACSLRSKVKGAVDVSHPATANQLLDTEALGE